MKPESLTPLGPKGSKLLHFLVGRITRGAIRKGEPESFVTYAEALRGLGISEIYHAGQQLNREGLAELNDWTKDVPELPKIAALIVNQDTHRPSAPFFESYDQAPDAGDWWMEQANRAIDFDWSPYLALAPAPGTEEPTARVRESEDDLPDYRGVVTLEPAPAHIRETKITVGEILRRLAAGQSEAEILRSYAGLSSADIRASLAYAADRERQSEGTARKLSRLSSFAAKWGGRFTLPKSAPDDPRMDYLLERYWRHRK